MKAHRKGDQIAQFLLYHLREMKSNMLTQRSSEDLGVGLEGHDEEFFMRSTRRDWPFNRVLRIGRNGVLMILERVP